MQVKRKEADSGDKSASDHLQHLTEYACLLLGCCFVVWSYKLCQLHKGLGALQVCCAIRDLGKTPSFTGNTGTAVFAQGYRTMHVPNNCTSFLQGLEACSTTAT